MRVIEDLQPVVQSQKSQANSRTLIFVYFAARWDDPTGDQIFNEHLGEKTNIAARLINLCEDPENSCDAVVLREPDLRMPSSYSGKDFMKDPIKTRASHKYTRLQSSIPKFCELVAEQLAQRKVLAMP